MSQIEQIKTEIERLKGMDYPSDTFEQSAGFYDALDKVSSFIDSLNKENSGEESNIKSPFTGGKVILIDKESDLEYRGEKLHIVHQVYHCVDTGNEFTDSKLDDDMMWTLFRAYCEKKGIMSFKDILPEGQKIKDWVARDKNGEVWFHYVEPHLENEIENAWLGRPNIEDDVEKTWWGSNDAAFELVETDSFMFQDLTFEGGPREYELIIREVK